MQKELRHLMQQSDNEDNSSCTVDIHWPKRDRVSSREKCYKINTRHFQENWALLNSFQTITTTTQFPRVGVFQLRHVKRLKLKQATSVFSPSPHPPTKHAARFECNANVDRKFTENYNRVFFLHGSGFKLQ